MVSEGMEVWVSWHGVEKFASYEYQTSSQWCKKNESEKERDVVDKCEGAKEGGKRGKGHD